MLGNYDAIYGNDNAFGNEDCQSRCKHYDEYNQTCMINLIEKIYKFEYEELESVIYKWGECHV